MGGGRLRPDHDSPAHAYSAYGLELRSAFRLDGLSPGDGRADIRIVRANLPEIRALLRQRGSGFARSATETCLHWEEIGTFVVREGREILVDPAPAADPGEIQIALLGPAVAALLGQRGYTLLHASGVVVDGAAALFLGSTGWGKSTVAAALHRRGHLLLVDDLAAVRCDGPGPVVMPAFPHFKLWPDTLDALGEDPGTLPAIGRDYIKRRRTTRTGYSSRPVRLQRIYLLATGEAPSLEPMSPAEAFLELTVHSYGIRWFLDEANLARFPDRARLAARVPMARLRRPGDLARLPELAALVEGDLLAPPVAHRMNET